LGTLAKGEAGISSASRANRGKERPTATSAPPALTFKAVANSKISLPAWSRARMKMGTARGNRSQRRRSFSAFWLDTRLPRRTTDVDVLAPTGPNRPGASTYFGAGY